MANNNSVCVIYVFLSWVVHVLINAQNTTGSCMRLYEKGVEAYLDNRFEECVSFFENALEKYRDYTKRIQNCRARCQQEAELSKPLYPVDINNLLFYEKTVKTTLCIIKCKQGNKNVFLDNNVINQETEELFENAKPYEYLHLCYFQNKEYQKAASAAFTYLTLHPDDKVMSSNLKHYAVLNGVDMREIVNFEAKDYVYLYIHGVDAYEKKDWNAVVQNMEESLIAYLQAEEECRFQCEGPFDPGWYPDFIPSIANHFTYCLKCKQKCRNKLNSLNGEKHDDLLPSHYHYLQYSYFQLNNLKAACAAVASYLLFYPDDETMLNNMKYYRKFPKASDDFFTPRPEAVNYVQRQMYEKKLLNFIFKEFKFDDPSKQATTTEGLNYRIIMTDKQLQGRNRFVAEGLATDTECKILINMVKMFAIVGDGYEGKKSPHSVAEQFEGITINRTTFLVYFGLLHPKYLKLYLKLTENAKRKVQQFFNIEKELYFTYTHLVCRSALPDFAENYTDFSHQIHADNCNALNDNTCEKLPPSYTWRDYSAIIYLNQNFDGGEFIFSADTKGNSIQSTIKPKCGRMIAFSSGFENLHGVRAVRKGSRCAIGIWFTFDPVHQEKERTVAYKLLNLFK